MALGAVRMLAGFEIRRRWPRVVALTLLVGVIGAVVLSTMAGARRSESALTRFNTSSRAGSLELTVGNASPSQLRAFGAVRGVAAFAPLRGIGVVFPRAPQLQAIASAVDNRFGTVVDRARLVAGRAADPTVADEATIGEALAAQLHLRVGDHLDGRSYSPEQVAMFMAGDTTTSNEPMGPRFRLQIVGIVRRPLDLGDRGASGGVLVLTPAFNEQYQSTIGTFGGDVLRVRTVHGAVDVPRVAVAARRVFGKSSQFGVQDLAIDTQGAQSAIDVLTIALWVFAGVTALAGLVAITIVLGREISLSAADQTTQNALGLTRRQRIAVGSVQALPVALGGALLALVGAALASPRFPLGVARRAEPDPGLHFDWAVLGPGTVVIVAGILLVAFVATLRTTRRLERTAGVVPGRMRTLATAASGAGVTPVATIGVQMALEPGRGPNTVPIRSAILGAVFGVLGIVAVLSFTANLDHLVATPARYGWTWDFAAVPDDPSVVGPRTPLLHVRGLAALSEVDTVNLQLDGRPVTGWGFRSLRGAIGPEIIAGRAPRGAGEVALGAATIDELGKHLGDTVHGEGPDGAHRYRIVGRAVFPKFDYAQPLANGAAFSSAGLARVLNPRNPSNASAYLVALVAPGTPLATVEHGFAATPNVARPFGPSVPVEVDRLRQVNWLPATLAALLGILALLAVGHALVTNVRRRRHELAVLKTLGF
ncbi:MAG: putative transport system permease protein, partial [Actinomycetota bacterium]|nr:putative transport system permease protein [Actinomycetota bacterium]